MNIEDKKIEEKRKARFLHKNIHVVCFIKQYSTFVKPLLKITLFFYLPLIVVFFVPILDSDKEKRDL